jgi:transcriptional regulator with XRE-family HTH domain
MAQTALGAMLQFLREQRGLSLRELARLAEIDHAYIYRLESGDKESPSDEALTKLIRALKADRRDADMLRYLAEHSRTDVGLVMHILKAPDVPFDVFAGAASAVFRGEARPDYEKLINRVRRIIQAEDGDG